MTKMYGPLLPLDEHLGLPLPPRVSDMLTDPSRVRARYSAKHPSSYERSHVSPSLFRLLGQTHSDTPSASLYRLYKFFILDRNMKFRDKLEYFCCSHPDWAISSIPKPTDDADPDPVRCTVLAVLTQLMRDAFNRRIEYGLPRDAPPIVTDFAELAECPKVFEETPD